VNKWVVSFLAGILAVGLLATGCGGGGDGGGANASGAEAPPTANSDVSHIPKAVFVRRANAICVQARKEYAAEYETKTGSFATKDNPIFTSYQTEVDRIRALGTPRGDEDQVEELLDTLQQAVDAGELPGGRGVPRANVLLTKFGPLAAAYGLTHCPTG
jgi:hypothetical protein